MELSPKVGDGGNRKGGISWGCLTPPLLHQRRSFFAAANSNAACAQFRRGSVVASPHAKFFAFASRMVHNGLWQKQKLRSRPSELRMTTGLSRQIIRAANNAKSRGSPASPTPTTGCRETARSCGSDPKATLSDILLDRSDLSAGPLQTCLTAARTSTRLS